MPLDLAIGTHIGNSQAAGLTYYVDSVAGNDGNSGVLPTDALQTLGALPAFSPGLTVALKKGSEWREELAIDADSVTIKAYGSGAAPIIRADDVLTNASFAKTGGRTNVYEISVTPEWSGNDWLNVWEDDAFLVRVADVATCDTTPGSYYPSAATGTITLYVHASDSSDVTSNGKVYETAIRQHPLSCKDQSNCAISGLDLRRCLSDNAVFELGPNGRAENLTVSDGTAHNVYHQRGTSLTNVTATGGYYGTDTLSLFVLNDDTPASEGVTITDCTADGGTENTKATGFYSHVNVSGDFGTVVLSGCSVVDCLNGYELSGCATVTISSCDYSGFNDNTCKGIRISDAADLTVDDFTCTLILGRALTWTVGNTTSLINSEITWTGLPNTGALYSTVATELVMTGNTFTGIDTTDTVLWFNHADASIYARTNTFDDPFRVYNKDTAGTALDSDYNHFTDATTRFDIDGDNYTTVAAYVAGTGQDQNSTGG